MIKLKRVNTTVIFFGFKKKRKRERDVTMSEERERVFGQREACVSKF